MAEILLGYGLIDEVTELFREYDDSAGPDANGDAPAAGPANDYALPYGRLYVIREQGQIAGCAALKRLDGTRGELKRLYVRPEFRGRGLGRMLTEQIIDDAAVIGYRFLRLDAPRTMTAALALFERLGFQQIAPYRPDLLAKRRFMEIKLRRVFPGGIWV